jgi:phosphomannomutase
MSFPYKLAAFDLDGTLAESKKSISAEMGKLLYELSLEHKVVVISGGSILQYEKQLLPFLKPSLNIILLPVEGTEKFEYSLQDKKWKMTEKIIFPIEKKNEVKKVLKEIIESGKYGIGEEHWGDYVEDRDTEIAFAGLGVDAPLERKEKWDPDRVKRFWNPG